MLTGLRLEPVTQENVRAACKLKIRPDQEDLVAPVAWSLAEAYTVPDIAWPRLIYDGGQLVGFIMAAFDPEDEDALFRSYRRLGFHPTGEYNGAEVVAERIFFPAAATSS